MGESNKADKALEKLLELAGFKPLKYEATIDLGQDQDGWDDIINALVEAKINAAT